MKTIRIPALILGVCLLFPTLAAAAADPPETLAPIKIISAQTSTAGQAEEEDLTIEMDKGVFALKLPDTDYIAINVFWKYKDVWNDGQVYQLSELARLGDAYLLKCATQFRPEEVKLRFCYVTSSGSTFSVLKYYDFSESVPVSVKQSKNPNAADVPTSATYARESNWAKSELDKAAAQDIIAASVASDLSRNISREEFAEEAMLIYNKITGDVKPPSGLPFSDSQSPFVARAAELGIVTGIGNNLFNPGGSITREQLAAMIYRLAKLARPKLDIGVAELGGFTDAPQISSWALEPMKAMVNAGIMMGSGNKLNPRGYATREQAVIMALRALDKFR